MDSQVRYVEKIVDVPQVHAQEAVLASIMRSILVSF